jgi:hypothetical protein
MWLIICPRPEGEVQIMSHIISPSERALTNYPTTQPLTWPFLTALAELRRLEETATHGNQVERKIIMAHVLAHSSIVTMATGNKEPLYPHTTLPSGVTGTHHIPPSYTASALTELPVLRRQLPYMVSFCLVATPLPGNEIKGCRNLCDLGIRFQLVTNLVTRHA